MASHVNGDESSKAFFWPELSSSSSSSSSSSEEEIGSDNVEKRRVFLRSYKFSNQKPGLMKKMKQCFSRAKRRLAIPSSWKKQQQHKLLKPLLRVKRLVWAKLRAPSRKSVCCCCCCNNSNGCPRRFYKISQERTLPQK